MTVTLIEADVDPYIVAIDETYIHEEIYWPGFGGGIMSGSGHGDLAKFTTAQYGVQSRFIWDIDNFDAAGAAPVNGTMLNLRSYGGQLRDFVFVGTNLINNLGAGVPPPNPPAAGVNYTSADQGILMQAETIISGSAGAGGLQLSNIGFAGLQTGIQFGGGVVTEGLCDTSTFTKCEFNRCDVGVKSLTQNALDHVFNSPIFRLTTVGFKVTAGGNWVINNPLIIASAHVFLDFTDAITGVGPKSGSYTVNNVKVDNQYTDAQLVLMDAGFPISVNFIGGGFAYDAMTTAAFTIYDGCCLNITGFQQLQNNHIVFHNTGPYRAPIINITGCLFNEDVADSLDIFNLAASEGYAYANLIGNGKILDADPAGPFDASYQNRMVKLTGLA